MSLTVETMTGAGIASVIPALARLRITVFREWPYLYAGDDPVYEEAYLAPYVNSPGTAIIIARHGTEIVGASTCLPLKDEAPAIQAPFARRGLALEPFFYFGESVVLPQWRGHGLGKRFFMEREKQARRMGAGFAVFCAVRRAPDHPQRPANAPSLHEFWRRRGFVPLPAVSCSFTWREPGSPEERDHDLDFWIKPLDGPDIPPALLERIPA
ncbi:GNAT family N-acetyltransferase [Komagataeibacter sp. FNDCF1]|uniref:GNAT family N-acetyltransferase n=1 Tax=Komagataeibacter sp. FNDCF1 TaxID=2878681 RepID=UPI001E4CCA04|nr:GNAT family N-acetyltransferase [Komagataeibacter sp. FNDCF1]MCE2565149.1 GNAT family N-acetyltransferase [Komagataeibacter sp. FNDCF1]